MENLNEEDKIEEEEEEIKPEKKTKKQKKQEEEELYNKEWDDKVSKLHAHDLLTFKIKKRDFETFFEVVDKPVVITCAYYAHEEKQKLDLRVESPSGKEIAKIKKKNRGFYEFEAKEKGKYEFIVSNERVNFIILFFFRIKNLPK